MALKEYARTLRNSARLLAVKASDRNRRSYECPICRYNGPFLHVSAPTGVRRHAQCPRCDALERHRVQFLVVQDVLGKRNPAMLSMLHFAPEPFFRDLFSRAFGRYETADLEMDDVDHKVDILQLPFSDASYDFVYASHVLEHIRDDARALSELRRILKPNGVAILPVPVVATATIEYPEPNPQEFFHVRAPGFDYFDRYERYFRVVERFRSDALPERHQPFVYEDRSRWPTAACPQRPPMAGERHVDVCPVCYV